MAYIGQNLTEGTRREYTYVATAGQTTFNAVYTVGAVDVFQNGVLLQPSDYTATDGTTVVLGTGAALDDEITIHCHNTFSVADTVSASQGGTFNNDVTVSGDFTVDTNILYVDSTNNFVGVGTSSPDYKLHVEAAGDNLKLSRSGAGEYTIGVGAGPSLVIEDKTAAEERMRIDASGNTLFNKATAGTTGGVGVEITNDGALYAFRDNNVAAVFNRDSSTGDLIHLRNGNNTFGVIGSDLGSTGFLVIGQNDVGLGFIPDALDSGNRRVIPRQTNTAGAANGTIDLGDTGSRFRDVHISRRVVYDGTNVRNVVGSAYNSFNNANSTTTNGTWITASGSTFTYTPQRSDTTIAVFADANLGYAWSNVSGTNHGYILARIVVSNGSGTFYSSDMEHWGRVDNFTGTLELTANHIEEYHVSSSVNNGSTITVSLQYQRVVTAGAGPDRGGINVWGSNSIITVEEYI